MVGKAFPICENSAFLCGSNDTATDFRRRAQMVGNVPPSTRKLRSSVAQILQQQNFTDGRQAAPYLPQSTRTLRTFT